MTTLSKSRRIRHDGYDVGWLTGDLLQVTCLSGIDKHRYGADFSIRYGGWLRAVQLGGRVLEVVDYPKHRFYRVPLIGSGRKETTNLGLRYLIPMQSLERQPDRA